MEPKPKPICTVNWFFFTTFVEQFKLVYTHGDGKVLDTARDRKMFINLQHNS